MLDPAVCAGMELDVPRVTAAALINLHRLLIEFGFRKSFQDESHIVLENRDEQKTATNDAAGAAPAEHRVRSEQTARNGPLRARKSARASRRPPDASGKRDGGEEQR